MLSYIAEIDYGKEKAYSRFEPTRKALIFWTLFIGIGAVCGAVGMLVDPSGKAFGKVYYEKSGYI